MHCKSLLLVGKLQNKCHFMLAMTIALAALLETARFQPLGIPGDPITFTFAFLCAKVAGTLSFAEKSFVSHQGLFVGCFGGKVSYFLKHNNMQALLLTTEIISPTATAKSKEAHVLHCEHKWGGQRDTVFGNGGSCSCCCCHSGRWRSGAAAERTGSQLHHDSQTTGTDQGERQQQRTRLPCQE